MRHVINWLKGNPITVAAMVVGLLSVIFLSWVMVQGGQFRSGTESEVKRMINELEGYRSRRVMVPSSEADMPPVEYNITVNERAIRRLDIAYRNMTSEYSQILNLVLERNRTGHELFYEALFPRMANLAAGYEARAKYRDALKKLLSTTAREDQPYRLIAGLPPTADQMQQVVDQAFDQYVQNEMALGLDLQSQEITEQQKGKLIENQKGRLVEFLRERAGGIHLYAQTDMTASDYPLIAGDWLNSSEKPPIDRLWEAQMELWIQQDILKAIARANRTDEQGMSVKLAPVKVLLDIEVIPGYIGHDTGGGLGMGGGGSDVSSSSYGGSGEFNISPTGRSSNDLYLVRHAKLDLIVDYQKLPALFNAISEVSFMTVIDCQFEDYDDFEAMRRGYYFDKGDAYRVEMIVESIWMHDWITRWMPDSVKESLDIPVTPVEETG